VASAPPQPPPPPPPPYWMELVPGTSLVVPEHLQVLRESQRGCVGNRVTSQLRALSQAREFIGYTTFSRDLPILCETRRQFGYIQSEVPVISSEIAIQAAAAARFINTKFIEPRATHGPARDCAANQSEVAMCHFLRRSDEKCMAMCSTLPTYKVNWERREVVPVIVINGDKATINGQPMELSTPKSPLPTRITSLADPVSETSKDPLAKDPVPKREPQYEWVQTRPTDLVYMQPAWVHDSISYLNLVCLAPDQRDGNDPAGLVVAASVESTGFLAGHTDVHFIAPYASTRYPDRVEVGVQSVNDLYLPQLEDQLHGLSSLSGAQIRLEFPKYIPPTPIDLSLPSVSSALSTSGSARGPLAESGARAGLSGPGLAGLPADMGRPPPPPAPVLLAPGDATLDLRCIPKNETYIEQERKAIQPPAPQRRQTDVYTATQGKDGSGRITGLVADDAIEAAARKALRAQSAPKAPAKIITVEVERTRKACSKNFDGGFTIRFPVFGQPPTVVYSAPVSPASAPSGASPVAPTVVPGTLPVAPVVEAPKGVVVRLSGMQCTATRAKVGF